MRVIPTIGFARHLSCFRLTQSNLWPIKLICTNLEYRQQKKINELKQNKDTNRAHKYKILRMNPYNHESSMTKLNPLTAKQS